MFFPLVVARASRDHEIKGIKNVRLGKNPFEDSMRDRERRPIFFELENLYFHVAIFEFPPFRPRVKRSALKDEKYTSHPR